MDKIFNELVLWWASIGFYSKLGMSVLLAFGVFGIMMVIQKNRKIKADKEFEKKIKMLEWQRRRKR